MMKTLTNFILIDGNHNSFSINSDGLLELDVCRDEGGKRLWSCVDFRLDNDDVKKLKRVLNTITKKRAN